MNISYDLWVLFFGLTTVSDLRRFEADLDPSVPEQAALAYYIRSWPAFKDADDQDAFDPALHLSQDRSAVFYGTAPVIFEGTNLWALKPYMSTQTLVDKMKGLRSVVTKIRHANPSTHISMVLVTEKDYVISRFMLNEDRFRNFDAAVADLSREMAELDISMVSDKPFVGTERFQTLEDFNYMDSHLTGQNYVTLFGFTLEALGVSWADVRPKVGLLKLLEFGDLASKFDNGQPASEPRLQPDMPAGAVTQVAGAESFADPLGDTWQEFHNDAPLVDESVCLLGDSHCSIFAQRKMTYLFANTFRETRFEWNPCGIRQTPDVSNFDKVVLEISSRFIV